MRNPRSLLLGEGGDVLTARQLADALWLARYVPASSETACDASPGIVKKVVQQSQDVPTGPILSPATGLPEFVALSRALRPLRRTVPSRTVRVVDEAATAETTAKSGVAMWHPVLRPAAERWLDVALVADDSSSMIVWQSWIANLRQLLERAGVFRKTRVWLLDTDTDRPLVLRPYAPGKPAHNPMELIDRTGRQTILLLSDCVGRAWHTGAMFQMLQQWGRSGTVTVVQPLAERMWTRCGPELVRARVATQPGWRGRTQLHVIPEDSALQHRGSPVLVIQLDPTWLNWWASLLTSQDATIHSGVALLPAPQQMLRRDDLSATAEDLTGPQERVGRFRASASPRAFELAAHLATVPVSLPTMTLIQSLTPGAAQLHLAEVLLGGLLIRVGDPLAAATPSEMQYDFHPGVRAELLSYLSREETVSLLQATGEFLHARLDRPMNLRIATPLGSIPIPNQPFAAVAHPVLQRLGGAYANAAAELLTVP